MARKAQPYLSNTELLEEIEKSKLSYCSFIDPKYKQYDKVVFKVEHCSEEGTTYRLYTDEHIPEDVKNNKSKKQLRDQPKLLKVNFPSFQHIVVETGGNLKVVCKSHWVGGIDNGHFSIEKGRITNNLAIAIMKLSKRLASKGNFNGYTYADQFVTEAICQLCENVLKFNETKSNNPFAYMTRIAHNAMVMHLKKEKALRDFMDREMLEQNHLTDRHRSKGEE